jgi:hypothetical protein
MYVSASGLLCLGRTAAAPGASGMDPVLSALANLTFDALFLPLAMASLMAADALPAAELYLDLVSWMLS